MNIKNKRVIVTGAGAGIGKELVLQLLLKGAYVIALDINEKGLENTKEFSGNNEKLSLHIVDISDDESINNFKKEYFEKYDVVDILINNAGIIQPFVNVNDIDINTVNRVMNVNFYGPLKLTKLFLPELLKRGEANITNISSMGGFFPFPGQTIYGSSKAALKLFTEGLYAELLDTKVHVMAVFPGAIATDIAKNSNVEVSSVSSNIKITSPSKAAETIIKGIEKNKFKLYIGNDSKTMNFLYKMNDKFAINLISKKMKDLMKK